MPAYMNGNIIKPRRRSFFSGFGTDDKFFGIGIAIITIIALIGGGTVFAGVFHEAHHAACVVESKDRTTDNDGDSHARVYTENCGVFEVQDSITRGRFDSADDYGRIKEGHTYDFDTIGFRIPIFSSFPNIIDMHEVK